MAYNGENKSINDGIANTHDAEQILRGVQPKHQVAYKIYRFCKIFGITGIILAGMLFGTTFIEAMSMISTKVWYRYIILGLAAISIVLLLFGFLVKALFLRKAPFDDWVFEIAEKRIGTSIIFYDSHYIYLNYDRGGKEVDKRDFVSEMSDKSVLYSYYYIRTDINIGYIQVECKKRQPIPNKALFKQSDDTLWNAMPLGLTINPNTQSISAIAWYLNDQNKEETHYNTVPSTSILICGGTGCYNHDTPILMYNTLVR